MTECKTSEPVIQKPFEPGLPHVACVLLWYPLFTQPFIFREVQGLRKRLPVSVYSLYGANLRHLFHRNADGRAADPHPGHKGSLCHPG